MRPTDIAISNYRSIRRLSMPIQPLSVFVGENGVGKSNLYKSLSLLRDAATGRITRTIADEGGLNSVFWSGPRKRGDDARLRLAASFDHIGYSIELGFPFGKLDGSVANREFGPASPGDQGEGCHGHRRPDRGRRISRYATRRWRA
nr:AAA family ATPase [Bradyrhizobium tropiciagri]